MINLTSFFPLSLPLHGPPQHQSSSESLIIVKFAAAAAAAPENYFSVALLTNIIVYSYIRARGIYTYKLYTLRTLVIFQEGL